VANTVRVLYINPFSQEVSGPDESLRVLLSRIIPLGVEAHVAVPAQGPQIERYRALGATVHVVPLTALRRKASMAELLRLMRSLATTVPEMIRLCRRVQPDLVHTNMEVAVDGLLAAHHLEIPHVLHYRGNTLDEPRLVFDLLVRFWTSRSRRVFCISEATAFLFRSRGRADKTEVVYNPVDLAAFAGAQRDDATRVELGASPGSLLIGTVARLHPRKDLETFIRAAALISQRSTQVRFVVVGSAAGPEERAYAEGLRALALRLAIADRVHWAGARRDIPGVMKALDVFVLTSRHEGFGRVVAEAMASGCPVVVSDEGALPELVDGGRFGVAAQAGDPTSFASKIEGLISQPALRSRLGMAGQARSRAFDSYGAAGRILATYQSVLAQEPKSTGP
jgi:glycosyltransferase involved in cell wall biosynthesis